MTPCGGKQHQTVLELGERSQAVRNALNSRHRACADHVNRGTCSNVRTNSRKAIERRVLSGIKEKLLSPKMIEVFVREFTAEWNARIATQRQSQGALEAELAEVERRLRQTVDAIEQGIVTATTKDRLLELEARRERLKADLAKTGTAAAPPALRPGLADIYRRKVADLEATLDDPTIRTESALALRGLIECVVLHPGLKRGEMRAELHGALAALINLAPENAKTRTSRDVRVSLVAGAGFEPATFRL